jgi:glucosamine--fructose-6-phosphate aminotransferase (isomerizing)
MSYLLATVVGHLFGYHAAARFDSFAERLRGVRGEVLGSLATDGFLDPTQLSPALAEKVKELDGTCTGGQLNGGLEAGTATRLARAFEVLLGWLPVNVFARHHGSVRDGIVSSLSDAIGELSRPIDAIKHQAKTVTVGISRGEAPAAEGALLGAFKGFGLPLRDLAETHRAFLAALEPLVAAIEGITLYRVEGLDPLGRPCDGSTIRVLKKTGCAKGIASRSEDARPLSGTKWGVVKEGDLYVGVGKTDGRKILITPLIGERPEGHLVLFHLDLVPRGRRDARMRALRAREMLLERIQIATTERNVAWDDGLIDLVDNDSLFFTAPDAIAEELVERTSAAPARK